MQIIKNRAIIRDQWRLDDGLGNGGRDDHAILPLDRYLTLRRSPGLKERAIGVKLSPDEAVESIAADLDRIALVALEFGSFHEGRGYSQAAQLRQQHRFTGEIRALGAHRDNLPLMERCGIDAYQLAEGEDIEQALSAFEEITEYYQADETRVL